MRETRLSGSEGGAGPVTRPRPYPYQRTAPMGIGYTEG